MSEKISRDQVRHVATLARLELSEADLGRMESQLNAILEHVATLNSLATEGIEPSVHPYAIHAPLREDEVRDSLKRHEVLSQAPAVEDTSFAVPKVIEAGS